MKNIKSKGMIAMAAGMLAIASCTDFSDYNTAPEFAGQPGKTLWENISSDPELSDFAQAVKKAGYVDALSRPHYYTVWAPKNGSFNKDSLFALSDAKVLKEFVKNHIAEYNHVETDNNDSVIYMLNEKLYRFQNNSGLKFGGVDVVANQETSYYNHPCSNGLYYKLQSPATFRPSGYEYIDELAGVADSFLVYVKHYETKTLDEAKSVKGAIVNNEQTYDDSVMITRNSFFGYLNERGNAVNGRIGRALVSVEDSSYTMIIPTNDAWIKTYEKIKPYYNYLPEIKWQDLSTVGTSSGKTMAATAGTDTPLKLALPTGVVADDIAAFWTDSVAKSAIVSNSVFNNHNKYNTKLIPTSPDYMSVDGVTGDTIYTTGGGRKSGFKDIMASVKGTPFQLSNGWAYLTDEINFKSWEHYCGRIHATNVARVINASTGGSTIKNYPRHKLPKQISDQLDSTYYSLSYIKVEPAQQVSVPEIDFYLGSPLATKYHLQVVMVPNWLEDWIDAKNDEEREAAVATALPYTLRFDVNYTKADNTMANLQSIGEGKYVTDATTLKLDTLDLGVVEFPICYAGTGAHPNLKLFHTLSTFTAANRGKYSQTLRIADVILTPEDLWNDEHPEANLNKEEE